MNGDVYSLSYRWRLRGPLDTRFGCAGAPGAHLAGCQQPGGPIEIVYYYLAHGRTFPEWWSVFRDAASDSPDVTVGARIRYHVKATLPYHLYWDVTLRRLEPPYLIETETEVALGSGFRLGGPVRFRLMQQGDVVTVINEQQMRTAHRLPGPLRLLAARAFAFNHDRAMAQGERGLQRAVWAAAANVGDALASEDQANRPQVV